MLKSNQSLKLPTNGTPSLRASRCDMSVVQSHEPAIVKIKSGLNFRAASKTSGGMKLPDTRCRKECAQRDNRVRLKRASQPGWSNSIT